MITYSVAMNSDEYAAITAAIGAGALAARNQQLTEMLRHNRDHVGIANSIEREIVALERAVGAILGAKAEQHR